MNKKILASLLFVLLAFSARAQLYNDGLITNRDLISDWQNQYFNTATGVFNGLDNGVFEHHGPTSATFVNNGVFNALNGHTDQFLGPLGVVGAQEIGGAVRPYFYNLNFANGAGQLINITDTDGANVRNLLTFGNGITTTVRAIHQVGALRLEDGATYTGGNSDAQHVNGYVSKIGNDTFTFPVGNGSDLRTLNISAPAAVTDQYSVAWIAGDPTSTTDPSGTPALHPITSVDAATITAVSPAGQWDWIAGVNIPAVSSPSPANSPAGTGDGGGLTISVSIPDMTAFATAEKLRLVGWNGTQWINLSTGTMPYAGGTSYADGVAENSTLQGTMVPGISAIGIGALATFTISGSVFDDGNGLNDAGGGVVGTEGTGALNPVDGTSLDGTPIYVTLVNSGSVAVQTVPVSATGTYIFENVDPGTYSVALSTIPTGTTSADSPLPTGWDNVGENLGTGVGNDGSANGILTGVTVVNASVADANFGINKAPIADNVTASMSTQPVSGQSIVLNGSLPGVGEPTGSDSESEPTSGSLATKSIAITAIPTNGELWYNGSKISFGADGTTPPSVSNPFVIPNFDPSLLELKLTGVGYTSTSFSYAYVDPAGTQPLTPATYTLNWQDPLPVTLARFVAAKEGLTAQLSWTTTSESNSDRFEIEHRTRETEWRNIGFVQAKGESNRQANYSFVDLSPANRENLYRLKMIDQDGTFAYSRINSLTFDFVPGLTIYPNPAANQIKLKVGGASINEHVQKVNIYDLTGRMVYTSQQIVAGEIDVKNISTGTYIVNVVYKDGSIHNSKIQIVK